MTDTAVQADETAGANPAHPLDPATAAEYLAGRDIMAAAGLLADPVRFAYYGLEEPPKDTVLAGTGLGGRTGPGGARGRTGGCVPSCSTPTPANRPTSWCR